MNNRSIRLLTICIGASGAVLLVLLVLYVFNNQFYKQRAADPATPVVQENFSEALKEADKTFSQERDYAKAIEQVESIVASTSGSGGLATKNQALLNLASKYIRTDNKKALEIFSTVYNDQFAPSSDREYALEAITWHITSTYPNSGVDNSFVNLAMGPEGFGIAPDGVTVQDQPSMLEVAILAYNHLLKMNESRYVGHILMAETLNRRAVELATEDVEQINYHLAEGAKYLQEDLDESIRIGEYNSSVGSMLHHIVRTNFGLYQRKLVNVDTVYLTAESALKYSDQFSDEHFGANVVSTEVATRKMLATVIDSNFNLDESQKVDIKTILVKYFYNLPADDLERRRYLRGHGGDTSNFSASGLERRKALVYIANHIDPAFKNFLITSVGGWTEKDFEAT